MGIKRTGFISVILIFLLASCSAQKSSTYQETIDAAVLQTQRAQSSQTDETIATAVAATQTVEAAMQITLQAAVQSTLTAIPVQSAGDLSEEQLAEVLEDETQEASEAVEQFIPYAEESASNGVYTLEEIIYMEEYVTAAEEEIDEAMEYLDAYFSLYAGLAEETLDLLYLLEDSLLELQSTVEDIDETLNAIQLTLSTGQQLSQDQIEQMQVKFETIDQQVEEVKDLSNRWLESVRAEIVSRPESYLKIEPNQVVSQRLETIGQLKEYISKVQDSLVDGSISREEMNSIAVSGSNATASLDALQGNDRLDTQRIADSITGVTTQLARGELSQARMGVDELRRSLPGR